MTAPINQLTLAELKEALELIDDKRNEGIFEETWESVTNWLTGEGYVKPHHQFNNTEEFMNWMRF